MSRSSFSKIPARLSPFQQTQGYYITYYGEIYYGLLVDCIGYDDGFFIIPNINLQRALALTGNQRSPENLRQLGIEIKDHRIIVDVLPKGYNFTHSPVKSNSFSGQQFKRMFLFGAAASTYCVFGENGKRFRKEAYNPPMAIEVFDEKYRSFIERYPAVGLSLPGFEAGGKDIEGFLDHEWRIFKDTFSPDITARHLNIQFYLQELFYAISSDVISKENRNNLYSLFCQRLYDQLRTKSDQVDVLVSFNYDTILDHYVGLHSKPLSSIEDYVNWHTRNVILFKPHGSVNWGWRFKNARNINRKDVIESLYKKKKLPCDIHYNLLGPLSQNVEYGSWGIEEKFSLNKNLIKMFAQAHSTGILPLAYPALLNPYRDKDEFVMPYQMQLAIHSVLNSIEELFLIGWKGNEALFNKKLKEQARRLKVLTIVNPDADGVVKNLKSAGIETSHYTINIVDNFENFVLNFN